MRERERVKADGTFPNSLSGLNEATGIGGVVCVPGTEESAPTPRAPRPTVAAPAAAPRHHSVSPGHRLTVTVVLSAGEVQAFYEDLSGRQYVNEIFNFSVDKLYHLLFTDSPFQRDFMEQRRFSGAPPGPGAGTTLPPPPSFLSSKRLLPRPRSRRALLLLPQGCSVGSPTGCRAKGSQRSRPRRAPSRQEQQLPLTA